MALQRGRLRLPLGGTPAKAGHPAFAVPERPGPLDGFASSSKPGCPASLGCGASPPKLDQVLGHLISAGAEIRAWLPPARRGLLVPGLDGQTPTSWAPAASSAVLRWLHLAMLASLAGATQFNAQMASKWAVETQKLGVKSAPFCFKKRSGKPNIAAGYGRFEP